MGDFSRDPRERLHDALGKHYVGVRLQQGVPILDTDWNESEDLRKHELRSLFRHFFGDGAPDDNAGFQIEALAGDGIGSIVLESAVPAVAGFASLELDIGESTAASILGFLPATARTEHLGSAPARLTGNASEPFPLADGLTLTVRVHDAPGETVTFQAGDFAQIAQATAAEVAAAVNAGVARAQARVGDGNDLLIRGGDGSLARAGRILVRGGEVVNESDRAYASQPLYQNPELAAQWRVDKIPALEPPSGTNRTDLVYLDVWERQVGATEDGAMVLPAVGIETALRLRREWAVRVAPGASGLTAITRLPGHQYLALATLERRSGQAAIPATAITDLTVRRLNVAKYLKTPIYLRKGTSLLDADRFADIMTTFKVTLITRLRRRMLPGKTANAIDQLVLQVSYQDLIAQAGFAAVQARTGNFNNADGLRYLATFHELQSDFLQVLQDFANVGNVAQEFIDGYRGFLDDPPDGLRPALDAGDLLAAAAAQEAVNGWLAQPLDVLPEGSVLISLRAVEPPSNLAFNQPFNVTYEIESLVSSPQAREVYDISFVTAAPTTWDVSLHPTQIEVDALGGRRTVVLTVTPRAGTASARFRLTATAARNPVVTFTHESEAFEVGQPPPTEQFFQWISPPLDPTGRYRISQADLADGEAVFQLNLRNTSEDQSQSFQVMHFVVPPGGQEGDWHPTEPEASPSELPLEAEESRIENFSLFGPSGAPVDSAGTLTARATLVAEGGAPVADGKSQTLEIPFVVVASS